MKGIMTLEQLLTTLPDSVLMDAEDELMKGIIPATGYTHDLHRKVNKMIDAGELCINPTQYRRVYMPSLARAIHKECARRYINAMHVGVVKPDENQLTLECVKC